MYSIDVQGVGQSDLMLKFEEDDCLSGQFIALLSVYRLTLTGHTYHVIRNLVRRSNLLNSLSCRVRVRALEA